MCISLVKKSNNTPFDFFSLQWHITSKCDQNCKHCYMYSSPFYPSERDNELSFEQCKKIIDDLVSTSKKWGIESGIAFTGGDPLLRQDFFELIAYARASGVSNLAAMGNSYHINNESAKRLYDSGIFLYQISLDGLQNTHDSFRKKGSFDDAIRSYKILKKAGIKTACMFTVSNQNKTQLFDVIDLVSKLEIDYFDFDRLVPTGNGKDLYKDMIPPKEYMDLLISVKNYYRVKKLLGAKTTFGYKDSLWNMIIEPDELPNIELFNEEYSIKHGCIIGKTGLAVLADGNVMGCRRLPVSVGKLPEQKIEEIYNSDKLNELRNHSINENCNSCDKKESCNGCRAIAYSTSGGNIHAKDPQCFKELLPQKPIKVAIP